MAKKTKKKELSPGTHTHTEREREREKKERSHLCLARNPHSKGPAFTQLKLNLGLTSDMVRAVVVVVVGSYILRADWVTRSGDRTWAGVCGGMGGCRRGKTRCCASQ